MFHVLVFLNSNQRALALILEAGEHAQFDLVLAGEFDRADLQHLGAEAGHFQHFLEGDGVKLLRFRHDARVGGVDAIDVGVDLALVGLERRGQRHAGSIRTATAEGGNVAVCIDALEAGDNDDLAGVEVGPHRAIVDRQDPRLGKGVVGENLDLAASVALRRYADIHKGHRQQPDGDLLASRADLIELARIRAGLDFLGQCDQLVGFTAHRRHHDHDLVTLGMEACNAPGDVLDALGVAHRSAAVFLNNQRHGFIRLNVGNVKKEGGF